MSRRIAFINEKGGSAKTTLVANLGAQLALHRGRRVLAIDMDPQGQLAKSLGVDPAASGRGAIDLLLDELLDDASLDVDAGERHTLPIVETRTPGLSVIPATKSLGLAPTLTDDATDPTRRLRDALDHSAKANGDYDYVLVDAPPSFGPLTLNILRAVDEVVVPVPLTYLALDGCAELLRTLQLVRDRYAHPRLRVTMVVPTFYRRTRMAHELLDRLKAHFPKEIAHTVMGFHVKIDEAQSHGRSVVEYAPRDRAAKAIAALTEELELRTPVAEEAR